MDSQDTGRGKDMGKEIGNLSETLDDIMDKELEFNNKTLRTLDEIAVKVEKIQKGVGEIEQKLKGMMDKLSQDFKVKPAYLMHDYKDIKEMQKQGYGKVVWRLLDFIVYRLVRMKVFVVYAYGKKVGFLQLKPSGKDTLHLANICFLTEYQNKGLGTLTLDYVKDTAKSKGKKYVSLYVRESNKKAIRVYERCGFVVRKQVKGYYRDTQEDGLLMSCEL